MTDAATSAVGDATFIFWLQQPPTTVDNDAPLLTEQTCILPALQQILQTVAPFAALAERDTAHLQPFAPELVARRDAVRAAKFRIDAIQGDAYTRIRDKLFPLARSGAMSAEVGNRAAHKLLESMDAAGITAQLFPTVARAALGDGAAGGGGWKSNSKKGKGNDRNKAKAAAATAVAADDQQQLTEEQIAQQSKAIRANRPKKTELVFVDVCGGPGSFAQALLCHVQKPPRMTVRGYGMTLHSPEVAESLAWYPKLVRRRDFTPTFGLDGSGSVYLPANVEALCSLCASEKQVHFVMGDGGFDVPCEQLAMQESITARLVFAQWYIALRLLSEKGALVLKLFETSSVFLRSMLTLSCLFFTHVAIVKPAHSRVVNSERYLSCRGFRRSAFTQQWLELLRGVHAEAFSVNDGAAPFTLLPTVSLNARDHAPGSALNSILRNLDESICATATRQEVGLLMIWNEYKRRTEQQVTLDDGAAAQQNNNNGNNSGRNDDDDDDAVAVDDNDDNRDLSEVLDV